MFGFLKKAWGTEPGHETKKRTLPDSFVDDVSQERVKRIKMDDPAPQIGRIDASSDVDSALVEAAQTQRLIGVFYDDKVEVLAIQSVCAKIISSGATTEENGKILILRVILDETLTGTHAFDGTNIKEKGFFDYREAPDPVPNVISASLSDLEQAIRFCSPTFILLQGIQHLLRDEQTLSDLGVRVSNIPVFATLRPNEPIFKYDFLHYRIEKFLNANIHGVLSEKRQAIISVTSTEELVVRYNGPTHINDTPLFKHLRSIPRSEVVFKKEFQQAKLLLREIGPFASDWVWRRRFDSEEELVEPSSAKHDDPAVEKSRKNDLVRYQVQKIVKSWAFTIPNLPLTSKGCNITPKVAKLLQILQASQGDSDECRAIVFVERRVVAHALVEILRHHRLAHLRAEALTGPWSWQNPHRALVEDFCKARRNMLISTKAGLLWHDLPRCTMVICFDLLDSAPTFPELRALLRPRAPLILMQNRSGDYSRSMIRKFADFSLSESASIKMTDRSTSEFPATKMVRSNGYQSASEDEDDPEECLKDPTMNGTIYPSDALDVICRYIASFSEESQPRVHPFVISTSEDSMEPLYTCTIIFPTNAPLKRFNGEPSVTTNAARQAACYQACKELYRLGLLPWSYFSRPKDVIRQLRPVAVYVDEEEQQKKSSVQPVLPPAPFAPSTLMEAQPQVPPGQSTSGTRCYKRKRPEFWERMRNFTGSTWYPNIVTVDRDNNPEKPYRPFLILTRRPLPSIPTFPLHFARGSSSVYLKNAQPMSLDEEQTKLLHRYTVRIIRWVVNKPVSCEQRLAPYLIAPIDFEWNIRLGMKTASLPLPHVSSNIPWDLVAYAANDNLVPLRIDDRQILVEDIQDTILQDRWTEFTRRYDSIRVREDLNPLSKLDPPKQKPKGKAVHYDTALEWAKSTRKNFEGLVDDAQSLIEVSNLPGNINRLQPTVRAVAAGEQASPIQLSTKFLIPELCCKCTIPASTMRTMCLLPSIMKRIDETLLVQELDAMYFNDMIDQGALQAAISAPSAGLDLNYERLELLGDSFLKYLSSVYLFVTNPNMPEGILHIARQKIVSNKSLLVNADKAGLPQYIQSKPFVPKQWLPRHFRLQTAAKNPNESTKDDAAQQNEKPSKHMSYCFTHDLTTITASPSDPVQARTIEQEEAAKGEPLPSSTQPKLKSQWMDDNHQWLGDKCVADVAEAIIGAAFLTGGMHLGLKVVKLLHVPLPYIDSWEDFTLKAKAPPKGLITVGSTSQTEIESIIGAKFARPDLLTQALTHNSVSSSDMTCYERLEFLGDAILDFLVIRHIFDLYGQLDPGALTLLKGAMVSNSILAAICVHFGLHKHLQAESKTVKREILEYVPQIELRQSEEYANAQKEDRMPGQYWLDLEPPKSIADIVESMIGALFVSNGFQLDGAQAMYDTMLRPFYDKHITLKTLSHHPTKILFELFQARGCQKFEMIKHQNSNMARCEVSVHDIILANGQDSTANLAARKASYAALDALEGDPEFMSRVCNCRLKTEERKAARRELRVKRNQTEEGMGGEDTDAEDVE